MRDLPNFAEQLGTTIVIANKLISKAFSALCCIADLLSLFKVCAIYVTFDQDLVRLIVLSLRLNDFAPIS